MFSGTSSKWFHQSMGHTNPLGFCFCAITGVIATRLLNLLSIRYVYSVHNLFSNDEQEDNTLTLCRNTLIIQQLEHVICNEGNRKIQKIFTCKGLLYLGSKENELVLLSM